MPIRGGGDRPVFSPLPSAAGLLAADLGPSLTPLSPALSEALKRLLLMSCSTPWAVSVAGSRGSGSEGGAVGSHTLSASLGGGSVGGGIGSVGGGGGGGSAHGANTGSPDSSVGDVVEAMVHMRATMEGAAAASRAKRVACGNCATTSSSSDRSSGFTEESAADTAA